MKKEQMPIRYEELKWERMWKWVMQNSSYRGQQEDLVKYWDGRAKSYNEWIWQSNRAEKFISNLPIDKNFSVLDIGAEPGTLAIPLAKLVKHITVVEPSIGMLSCLKENANKERIDNISCINKRWEDVEPGKDIGMYDLVIASYSLSMPDIKEAILKMDEVARCGVYLFHFAGRNTQKEYGELWSKVHNKEYKPGPDYIYLYNLLYQIGIYANVEISETEHKREFSTLEEGISYWKELLNVYTQEAEKHIKSYLEKRIEKEDGKIILKQNYKSAMIWWRKDEKSNRNKEN